MFSLGKGRLRGNFVLTFRYLKRAGKKDQEELFFIGECCYSIRGTGFNIKEGKLDTKKKVFNVKVVRQWNRLPREVVGAPSMDSWMGLWATIVRLSKSFPCPWQGS